MNRLWASLFLLASFAVGAETRSAAVPVFTMQDAVAVAVRDNPDLARLRAHWKAQQEQPVQARRLENPMFVYSAMDQASGGTWPDTEEKYYMLEQALPGFGKRGLRVGVARQEADLIRYELDEAIHDLVRRVQETYIERVAVHQVLALLQEEADLLRRIETVAETQYASGVRSQVDVLAAQTERTRLKQKQLDFEAQDSTLEAQLNLLLDRRVNAAWAVTAVTAQPDFGEEAGPLLEQAGANRPEVHRAQALIQRDELAHKLVKRESTPDYRVGVEYRDMGAGEDMAMVSFGIDLPIWRGTERAGIRAATKNLESARAALEHTEQQVAFDVQAAHIQWRMARRTLELIRTELVPQAEARFNASEAGYQTGQLDFSDLLDSERILLDAQIQAVLTEAAVGRQAARLEQAVGVQRVDGTTEEEEP